MAFPGFNQILFFGHLKLSSEGVHRNGAGAKYAVKFFHHEAFLPGRSSEEDCAEFSRAAKHLDSAD
jgi:hypothetical protein